MVVCTAIVARFGRDKLFFVSLPGWFVTVLFFLALSKVMQRNVPSIASSPSA